MNQKKLIKILKQGGVGVMPTDTIYGLVGSAFSKKAVKRIYRLKVRNLKKPFIILISSIADLRRFNIQPGKETLAVLRKIWPGKVSVILPCKSVKFSYLHQGLKSLAFRLPPKRNLCLLLKKTGPLVAPSANPEGYRPAKNITAAKKYFGDSVNFYVSGGPLTGRPSTLISLENGKIAIRRKGAVMPKV